MLAIFIVDADNKSKSDFIYISKYLRHFFTIGKQDVIRSVCLGGKGNYKKNSKKNEIKTIVEKFKSFKRDDDRVVVFCCVDIDDVSRTGNAHENRVYAKTIQNYCCDKNWEFVWFHETIEEVFWGRRVSDKEKCRVAHSLTEKSLESLNVYHFKHASYLECVSGTSNLDIVLGRFFERC